MHGFQKVAHKTAPVAVADCNWLAFYELGSPGRNSRMTSIPIRKVAGVVPFTCLAMKFARRTQMTTSKLAALGCLCAVSVTISLKADEWNKKTVFTFSAPVEIPGQVLSGSPLD
jgi:hypothetical protein